MAHLSFCLNCHCDLQSEEESEVDLISVKIGESQERDVPVIEILTQIYKLNLINYLVDDKSTCDTNSSNENSGPSILKKSLCLSCFNKFKNLYEAYTQFNQVRHSASFLFKEIYKLESLIQLTTDDNTKEPGENDESGVADCDLVILSDDEDGSGLDKVRSSQGSDEGTQVSYEVFDNEEIRVLHQVESGDEDQETSNSSPTKNKPSTNLSLQKGAKKLLCKSMKINKKPETRLKKIIKRQILSPPTPSTSKLSPVELTKQVVIEFQCDICWQAFPSLEQFQRHVETTHSQNNSPPPNPNQTGQLEEEESSTGQEGSIAILSRVSGPEQTCETIESQSQPSTTSTSPSSSTIRANETRETVITNSGEGQGSSIRSLGESAANTNTTTTIVVVTRPRSRNIRKPRKNPSKAHFTQKSPYWTQELLYPPPRIGVKVNPLAHVPLPDTGPPYECSQCQDIIDLASDFERHVKEEHFGLKNTGENSTTNPPTDATDPESEMTDNDNESQVGVNKVTTVFSKTGLSYTFKDCPPYQCPYCDLKGGTLDVMRNHIKGHHFNLDLTCSSCSEIFSNRTDLLTHLTNCRPPEGSSRTSSNRNSGGDDGQLFICEFCGKECLKAVYLKKHKQRVHGDDNAFPCLKCDKSFRTRTYLTRHMDCHVESRDFICHHCGGGFKSVHHLRMHVRRVHP